MVLYLYEHNVVIHLDVQLPGDKATVVILVVVAVLFLQDLVMGLQGYQLPYKSHILFILGPHPEDNLGGRAFKNSRTGRRRESRLEQKHSSGTLQDTPASLQPKKYRLQFCKMLEIIFHRLHFHCKEENVHVQNVLQAYKFASLLQKYNTAQSSIAASYAGDHMQGLAAMTGVNSFEVSL